MKALARSTVVIPQLVDEPVLQRAVEPLAAPSRLRRVGEDVLDPEARERAADLRGAVAIHGPAALRCVSRPARTVGVQRLRVRRDAR